VHAVLSRRISQAAAVFQVRLRLDDRDPVPGARFRAAPEPDSRPATSEMALPAAIVG
jgi:hypothetical protein